MYDVETITIHGKKNINNNVVICWIPSLISLTVYDITDILIEDCINVKLIHKTTLE